MRKMLFWIILSLIFAGSPSFAHNEHHDGENKHDHRHECGRYISKEEANIPDFSKPNWQLAREITATHRFRFFRNTSDSGATVSAVEVRGKVYGTDSFITRVSWQVGDKIRTVRKEVNEMVCENNVLVKDGKKYDINGMMQKLLEKQ